MSKNFLVNLCSTKALAHDFDANVMYKPMFLQSDFTKLLSRGENNSLKQPDCCRSKYVLSSGAAFEIRERQ